MIINDKDAIARLNSPMNLINRLRCASTNNSKKNNAMSLFGIRVEKEDRQIESKIELKQESKQELDIKPAIFNPFQPQALIPSSQVSVQPALDNILENHESQIKLGLAHDSALELLGNSVRLLATKLDDIKADRLPQVVTAASKVVESIRKERNEASKNNKDREVHYHFYTPQQNKVTDYEVIDVTT